MKIRVMGKIVSKSYLAHGRCLPLQLHTKSQFASNIMNQDELVLLKGEHQPSLNFDFANLYANFC